MSGSWSIQDVMHSIEWFKEGRSDSFIAIQLHHTQFACRALRWRLEQYGILPTTNQPNHTWTEQNTNLLLSLLHDPTQTWKTISNTLKLPVDICQAKAVTLYTKVYDETTKQYTYILPQPTLKVTYVQTTPPKEAAAVSIYSMVSHLTKEERLKTMTAYRDFCLTLPKGIHSVEREIEVTEAFLTTIRLG